MRALARTRSALGRSRRDVPLSTSFDPTSLAGLVAWFDGSVGVTGDPNVSSWTARAGGKTFTKASSGFPQYVASSINGRPAISFTASQYMSSSAWVTSPGPRTFAFVHKPHANSAEQRLLDVQTGRTTINHRASTTTHTGYASGGIVYAVEPVLTTTQMIIFGLADNDVLIRRNRVSIGSGLDSVDEQISGTIMLAAHYLGTTPRYDGEIAEFVTYSRRLTLADMQKLEDYWGAKYAL